MRHDGPVYTAHFSPDDRLVVTASADGAAHLWQAATGQYFGMLLQHRGPVNTACFGPDGRTVLTASDDGTARLWIIPRLETAEAAALADLAEVSGRLTIGDWGTLLPLSERDQLVDRLRTRALSIQQKRTISDLDQILRDLSAPIKLQESPVCAKQGYC
jgi:WD40 repeat protein